MHNSNKEDGEHRGMMWMMIPCLLLLGILFLGGGKLSSSGYLLPILTGAFVVACIWMIFRGHNRHRSDTTEGKIDGNSETKDEDSTHKHGGCCH